MNNPFESWFTPYTAAKEKEAAYYRKMYPFGKEQQDWEDEIIKAFYPNKRKVADIKFVSLVKREMDLNQEFDEDEYRNNITIMHLNIEDEKFIAFLVAVEEKATSLSELPTLEVFKEKYGKQKEG